MVSKMDDEPSLESQPDADDNYDTEQRPIISDSTIEEEDFGYLTVAKLVDGSSFGELALLEQKPRMATIRCLQPTHFMVLTKEAYHRVIAKIERKAFNEKVNFLRNIPVFQLLTRTSLGKMTYYFENKNYIKDSILFKEGESADYVYIVKSGEFQITKKILHVGPK